MKRFFAMLISAVMMFSVVGCSSQSSDASSADSGAASTEAPASTDGSTSAGDEDTIKIGALLSFTGSAAYQSALLKEGYDYAVKYWNEQGGIKSMGGKKLELVYADHTDNVEVGITEFERLKEQGCDIMTGDYSSGSVMLAVRPLCERYQIPYVVSQQSSLAVYTEENKWVFNPTNDASTNAQGLVGICQMIEEKFGDKIDGIGFIVENTEWGQSQRASFEKSFGDAGLETIYSETFELGATDFSAQITKMKATGVKFVIPVISAFNDAVVFVRQLKEYECNAGLLCCGGVMVVPEFYETMGDDANGIFSTDTWNPGFLPARGEKALEIHQGYVDEHGYKMNENAGCAWNSIAVIVAALEAAGSADGEAVQKVLMEMDLPEDSEYMIMTPFEGMKFGFPDNNGNYGHNIYGLSSCSQLIDGEWEMVWPDRLLGENNPIQWPIG